MSNRIIISKPHSKHSVTNEMQAIRRIASMKLSRVSPHASFMKPFSTARNGAELIRAVYSKDPTIVRDKLNSDLLTKFQIQSALKVAQAEREEIADKLSFIGFVRSLTTACVSTSSAFLLETPWSFAGFTGCAVYFGFRTIQDIRAFQKTRDIERLVEIEMNCKEVEEQHLAQQLNHDIHRLVETEMNCKK